MVHDPSAEAGAVADLGQRRRPTTLFGYELDRALQQLLLGLRSPLLLRATDGVLLCRALAHPESLTERVREPLHPAATKRSTADLRPRHPQRLEPNRRSRGAPTVP